MMLTPAFSHYLQSNQAPDEDETRELKALRASPLEEISIIDAEIELLKRKQAHIQESIDDFNTILAPVRRLSRDVLGVIFGHCLTTHRNPVLSASEAPILLTHICRDWRSIALSIPRLWSRLYIPTIHNPFPLEGPPPVRERQHRMEARTEQVQRWLRLSAACPLAISMPASNLVSHPPLLDTIIQSSRRWQQFELGFVSDELGFAFDESNVLTRLLSLSPDDLCMLQELRICTLYSTVNPHTQQVYRSGLLTAQGLRSISIGAIDQTNAFPAGIPPNWKNLNHLFIHSPILLGLAYPILSYCCNLVACLLHIDTIPDESIITSITLPSCILPHLTFLSVEGDLIGCSQIFSSIEAPSLRILDYQGYFSNGSEAFGLLNFLQNINSLKTLRVDHHHLTESNVLKYYTLIPSVTHLVLGRSPKQKFWHLPSHYAYPEQAAFLTILHEISHQHSPDTAPTVLFPSLEIFEAYDISGVTDAMLLEFIKARIDATKSNAGVSELKKVLVEFSRTRQTDIVPEALAYAQAAGIKLKLDLTYYTKTLDATWSPSYGLSPDDVSWAYPLYDY